MLKYLPPAVRGALTMLLIMLNTIVCSLPLLVLALVKLVIPGRQVRAVLDPLLNGIATGWISFNGILIDASQRTRWTVSGTETLALDHWYLVNCNHQSWVDILVLQRVFNRRIPLLKFFLKQELIYVPVIGLAWWALEFPFMRRHSATYLQQHPEKRTQDLETARRACARFSIVPTSVMNFPEGTRFTRDKQAKQRSPYQHLLRPRAGALGLSLSVLGSQFRSLLDVTIVYPDGTPTFWHFLCGRVGRIVVDVEQLAVPDALCGGDYVADAALRGQLQQWLQQLWLAKDAKISSVLAGG
jgi:1-acyl-sn-glycerol-3-phosphate acyltransferase